MSRLEWKRPLFSLSTLTLSLLLAASVAQAEDVANTTEDSAAWLHGTDRHPYSQMFTLEAGAFHPANLTLSNSTYNYRYAGSSLNSYDIEPGWSIKLFHLLGAVYLEENLAFSTFSASVPGGTDNLSLFMLASDTRVKYSMEWFPLRAFIPFVEGGYRFSFLSQSGASDFESAQTTVGNFVAGAGVDLWINAMFGTSHDDVNLYGAMPVFLTAKVNRILGNGSSDVNLDSTSVLAGLSIGI